MKPPRQITLEEIKRHFPNASRGTIAANVGRENDLQNVQDVALSQSMATWEQQLKKHRQVAAIDRSLLWNDYKASRDVHETGKRFNVSGETVRRLLTSAGFRLFNTDWSAEDIQTLTTYYATHTTAESFNVKEIAKVLQRTCAGIYLKASRLGLSLQRGESRPVTRMTKEKLKEIRAAEWESKTEQEKHLVRSQRAKEQIQRNGHPRGMAGKHHSDETKERLKQTSTGRKLSRASILKGMQLRLQRYGTVAPNIRMGSWRAGWRTIGGVRFYARSRWEANYGMFLQFQKEKGLIAKWEHEPETFWFDKIKRGCCSYLPDYRVTLNSGAIEYHEVKGWMDPKSKTKLKRMAKYYPAVVLRVIDGEWFKGNKNLSRIVPGWEF